MSLGPAQGGMGTSVQTGEIDAGAVTLAKTGTDIWTKGADVAAANNLVLGADGDTFHITGATQINLLASTNFRSGSHIRLVFDSTPTIKHGQTTSGANKRINLLGAADILAVANDTMTLVYDGTVWWQVSGSTALNAIQLAKTVPGAGGLAVLDDASVDAILTTLGVPATWGWNSGQRSWESESLQRGGNFTMIAASAYFIYLRQVSRANTPAYIRGQMVTAGSVTQDNAEVGFFTTSNPPNAGNQTLTPIGSAFKTTLDDLTAAGPLVRGNSVAMAVALTVGQHLWAGIRVSMSAVQPIFIGAVGDGLRGNLLVKTSAAAFDGTTTYAGVVPAISALATPVAPWLWAGFDA